MIQDEHFEIDKKSENYKKAIKIWNDFKDEIKGKNRFFAGDKILKLLNQEKNIDKLFFENLDEKFILYRARIGNYINDGDEEMGLAPVQKAKSGRCNPMGIAYLYLSTTEKVAMKEVRSKLGDLVTIAKIEIRGKHKFFLVNGQQIRFNNIEQSCIEDKVVANLLYIISLEFQRKIYEDSKFEYIPLQFISEYIKNRGFTGLIYKSPLDGKCRNYVLFNAENYKIIEKKLYRIIEQEIDFIEVNESN